MINKGNYWHYWRFVFQVMFTSYWLFKAYKNNVFCVCLCTEGKAKSQSGSSQTVDSGSNSKIPTGETGSLDTLRLLIPSSGILISSQMPLQIQTHLWVYTREDQTSKFLSNKPFLLPICFKTDELVIHTEALYRFLMRRISTAMSPLKNNCEITSRVPKDFILFLSIKS